MNWFDGKKAVVPIDFGDKSRMAVDTTLKIIFHPEDIHVVHVAPDVTTIAPEVVWSELADETRRQSAEDAFQREFGDTKYHHIPFHVSFGDPGHQIVSYAEEIGADIIIMPSHGRTGISRLLLGSVAERVLRSAHCPVLVLRD